MTKIDGPSLHATEQLSHAAKPRLAKCIGTAILLLTAGVAAAQTQPPAEAVQDGYTVHQTADLGGHMVGLSGSGAMYDTLVNIQSGPRVLGETFTMHAVEGTKHPLLDDLTAFSSGFGGDPNNFAKLDFSKGKLYEFSGMFRRDRQFFDYDLLGNPLVPAGVSLNIGPSTAPIGTYDPWTQGNNSPEMFNTVRRMTDTDLTVFPLSKVTLRAAYSQNIFQGPTSSPGESVGVNKALLQENMRNSTDDFIAAVDWKPVQHTKITFEEQVTHYKEDSFYTLLPSSYTVQEPDGTPASIGNWDYSSYGSSSFNPYSISNCNTGSMGTAYTSSTVYTILSPAQTAGGLPIINAACDAITSYLRSQPTRSIFPTEILRFQSSSIKNIATNGDIRYTEARSNLPNYQETYHGLDGATRISEITGWAYAKRHDVGIDYGITWQFLKKISLSDQVDFSNIHEPGEFSTATNTWTVPTTVVTGNNGYETINYPTLTPPTTLAAPAGFVPFNAALPTTGAPTETYYGQKILTNNLTATWDASSRATVSLTYRYRTNTIVQTSAITAADAITIFENGGILNVALRPANNWEVSGTVEAIYDDEVFTPISPRETQRYRIHSVYRPKHWATVSVGYSDRERHNNTNNITTWDDPSGTNAASAQGVLDHVDQSRVGSFGVVLAPNEHYGFDFNYSYSDVYTATNTSFEAGGPGGTVLAGTTPCPTAVTGVFCARDFMDAPTQYTSFALTYSPNKVLRSAAGYRISSVNGTQVQFNYLQVNGSLQSAYQSPYLNVAWTVHPGLVWKADYNYYGYGEGGPVGPTAPRNFHANNLTLAIHYEF